MAGENSTTLKINMAVDYLEKINAKQDDQQTKSLSQKMAESLSSVEDNTKNTNDILLKKDMQNQRSQKETTSLFRSILMKFLPSKDMNRTDDNDDKNFRNKLLKDILNIGDKLKGLKDKGLFGWLFGLLGGLLKGLFNGLKKVLFSLVSTLFRNLIWPLLKTITKPVGKALGAAGRFLRKTGRRAGRRTAVTVGRAVKSFKSGGFKFVDNALEFLAKRSTKLAKLVGGTAKGLAKVAGPIGIAVTALDAGVTAVHSIANAGKILGKSEADMGVYDRFRVGMAGIASSLTFGLVSTEKIIETQDKIHAMMWKGFRTFQSGFNKVLGALTLGLVKPEQFESIENGVIQFGRTIFHFFDNMIEDALEFFTGGTFWSDWRTGWDYLKNNFGDAVYGVFESLGTTITAGAASLFAAITNNPVGNWIKKQADDIILGTKYMYDTVIVNNPIVKFFDDFASSIVSSVKGFFSSIVNGLKDTRIGKYLGSVWKESKTQDENDLKNESGKPIVADPNKPRVAATNEQLYKEYEKAQIEKRNQIQSNVSNSFKAAKEGPYKNLKGADQQLAILMQFLLEQFAPYSAKLNAEAEKDGDVANVALVNPMK
jgi:hypothetical protein